MKALDTLEVPVFKQDSLEQRDCGRILKTVGDLKNDQDVVLVTEEDCLSYSYPTTFANLETQQFAQTSTFLPVAHTKQGGSHADAVLTDSLNTKSEERKFHSNSNEDCYSRSPSFYKIETSSNGRDGEEEYNDH